MAITTQMRTDVAGLYAALFARAPERDGLGYWVSQLDAGKTVAQVAQDMYNVSAARVTYPLFLTNSELIGKFYTNVLGRAADADGSAYWTAKLNAGVTAGQVISEMTTAVKSYAGTDAAALTSQSLFNNKVTVGLNYAVTFGGNDPVVAANVLALVTATDVTAANAAINGSASGSTFVLTSGVDNLSGTSGSDTFIADNTGTVKQLGTADQINGGAGTDTLKIYLAAADTVTGQPTLTSVENVFINGGAVTAYTAATGTTGLIIDAALQPAATTYTLSGQALTLQNLKPLQATTTTIASTTDTTENITLNAVVTGTTSTWLQTIDLSGTKVATATVTATGAASTITLTDTGAALATLNIAGDKAVTINETVTTLKTVNASTDTGGVTLNTAGATLNAAFAFTGGTGADKLTIDAATLTALTAGSQLDGGAGTDTLAISNTTLVAADYTKLNAIKGFEVLSFTAGATVDTAQITSVTGFSVDNTGTNSFQNSSNTTNYTIIDSANVTAVTVANTVGQGTVNVTLSNAATTAAAHTVSTLTLTGASSINLVSSNDGQSANTNVITSLVNGDNSAITVTGAAGLTLTLAAGTAVGSSVDGSAATGKLILTGSNFSDVLKGGSGVDTLTGGTGADVLTGGAGADTFVFSGAAAANTSGGTLGLFDEIKDFVVGTDKLQFTTVTDVVSAQQTAVQAAVTALAASATAAQIETAMATANTTNLGVSFATFGGNTYVLYETTGASTGVAADDVFIKLTGVTTIPTFAGDVTP
jgi:hypothetical protein